ncbi:MAG: hypothetical protein KKB30_07350 [Proteobacteria bacterium]|nr:hypothetical protein [Pseudomonadota bacterium]MBU1714960.1 hypothetical protein [Pseudomonadota bacterium]
MPKISRKKNPLNLILIILLAIITIGGITYVNWDKIFNKAARETIYEERDNLKEKINLLEREVAKLSEKQTTEIDEQDQPESSDQDKRPSTLPIKIGKISCEQLDTEIQEFFHHLDSQEYIKDRSLNGGSQAHVKRLIDKLLANPPIVVRETDSLFTILTNTAHFYRVLGPEDVILAKDILAQEAGILEPTMALFYNWSKKQQECKTPQTEITLPLQNLYEYAGFFLNTLGGQSYLFRRESHLRILIKYYCILILDRSNAEILNRHGIDIRLPIKSMINEIDLSENLLYKEEYMRTLINLKDKYHSQYE